MNLKPEVQLILFAMLCITLLGVSKNLGREDLSQPITINNNIFGD